MSARLNAADHTLVHAIGAMVTGYRVPENDAMFAAVVREALPHCSETNQVMHDLIRAGIELNGIHPRHFSDGAAFSGWRLRAEVALKAFHAFACGEAQQRLQEQLAKVRAA